MSIPNEAGTRLSVKEKSERRYESLNKIALRFSEQNKEFKDFAEKKWPDEVTGKGEITWRKLETFLKKRFGLSSTPGQYNRYIALNRIAETFARLFIDFKEFSMTSGDHMITWRKLETYLKRKETSEAVELLKIVIESAGGD